MNATRIVGYVPDLMDRSRLSAARPEADIRFVGSLEALADQDADVVVVDAARPGVLDVIPGLVARGIRVVAFGAHVDRATLDAARAAGCAQVLARSAFFADPDRWLQP